MPPGSAMALEARRDVDAIAIEVAALDDDVAKIDADAQHDPAGPPARRVCARHPVLQLDGAGDGVDGAGELHQHAVAHHFDDAPVMLGDQRLDQLFARRAFRAASVPASSRSIRRL